MPSSSRLRGILGLASPLVVACATGATDDGGATTTSEVQVGSGDVSVAVGVGGAMPSCGNGKVEAGEDCDQGASNSDAGACTTKCKKAVCGDALVQKGVEECDAGQANADSAACTSKCKKAVCGDALVQKGVEECDDGNVVGGDGCNANCTKPGGTVWTQTYDLDQELWAASAVDPTGNVLVVGQSAGFDTDVVVRKYDANGKVLWTQTFDGGQNDAAYGVTVDQAGNVYVVGSTEDVLASKDIWLRKYTSAGATVWTQTYNAQVSGVDDLGLGVAVNAAGDVFLAGEVTVSAATGKDIVVAKVKGSTGTVVWSEIVNSAVNGDDSGAAVAVDASGNVIVTGSLAVAGGTFDMWTRKYKDGVTQTTLWTKTYDGVGKDDAFGFGIATDTKGNVLVAGAEWTGVNSYDVLVAKYDPNGNLLWTKGYDGAAHQIDVAFAVAVDASDNVAVGGYEQQADQTHDAWVRQLTSAGATLWTQGHDGAAQDDDYVYGVAVDGSGFVYAAGGETTLAAGFDGWLRKYSP